MTVALPVRVVGTTLAHVAQISEDLAGLLGEQPALVGLGTVTLRAACPAGAGVPEGRLELLPVGEPVTWCPDCARYLRYLHGALGDN